MSITLHYITHDNARLAAINSSFAYFHACCHGNSSAGACKIVAAFFFILLHMKPELYTQKHANQSFIILALRAQQTAWRNIHEISIERYCNFVKFATQCIIVRKAFTTNIQRRVYVDMTLQLLTIISYNILLNNKVFAVKALSVSKTIAPRVVCVFPDFSKTIKNFNTKFYTFLMFRSTSPWQMKFDPF